MLFMTAVALPSGPEKLAVASLKGWSLLLSALPGWRLNSVFCDDALSQLSPHLSATAVEERAAAGEAIALLFSMSGLSTPNEAKEIDGQTPSSDVALLRRDVRNINLLPAIYSRWM